MYLYILPKLIISSAIKPVSSNNSLFAHSSGVSPTLNKPPTAAYLYHNMEVDYMIMIIIMIVFTEQRSKPPSI